jgi:hypothetical protein
MNKLIGIVLLLLSIIPLVGQAQSAKTTDDFVKFVSKEYKLADELKSNCEWMYAIVKVRTDAHNKIIKYEFVNEPAEGVKKGFSFLIGYQFPKAMKINKHPIVFYLSIDNSESCIEKPGDIRFYAPNQVVSTITSYYFKIFREDPNTIIIPDLVMKVYYPIQR